MEKCLIIGGQNPKNFGSLMLVENYINYSKYDRYYILTINNSTDKELYRRVIKNKEIDFKDYKKNGNKITNKFKLLLGMIIGRFNDDNYQKILNDIDSIVFLGGDDLSEDYTVGGLIYQTLFIYKAKRMKKKVYIISQTIGPFKSWRKKYMNYILSDVTKITVREPISYKYLIDLKVPRDKVKLSADLAFLPLNSTGIYEKEIDEQYVVICPSSIVNKYANNSNENEYLECLVNVCRYIIEEKKLKVVLLAHVCNKTSNDYKVCENIAKELDKIDVNNYELIKDEFLPVDARRIFKESEFVITGRMHPAISTLSVGKPVISIAYSIKYNAIIGEYANLPEMVIDVRYNNWNEVNLKILEQIDYILINKIEMESKIKKVSNYMIEQAKLNF
ncbi:polysaccharide pyruvyl transferase family protein [Clostridium tertium]|uniref:polysaccharide pyruvyl transferase family protein n=1 Tax=Clostridium tertium TaxID=1559 RepID=UPI000DD05C7D|nr:polysaccharide pyruvyl transferase family protein [Clostridium tertium]